MKIDTVKEGKTTAIVSYLGFLGTLIAMSMNSETKNEFASFHIRQNFGLCITFFVLGFVSTAFDNMGVTYGFWTFFFVLWLYGFVGVLSNKKLIIPIIGNFSQKLFKNM